MITKTQLDIRLKQLEESLKKRIDIKDNRQIQEINAEIAELKNTFGLLEEKIAENRDMIENYLKEHNNVKIELEELKRKVDGIKKELNIRSGKNKDDIIISDF
jgi:chromosome segregation ATPase